MNMKILAVLDPYAGYDFRKDSSHLLLQRLFQRDHRIFYTDPQSLGLEAECPVVRCSRVLVRAEAPWFDFDPPVRLPLQDFELILMRKDPPVDAPYLKAVELLALVEDRLWVINRPSSLREINEKLGILLFPEFIPKTIVTSEPETLKGFVKNCGGQAVGKLLDSFAGKGVRKITPETLWDTGRTPLMVQEYLPVERGEKRVFIIDGHPAGAILRFPMSGGFLVGPDEGGSLAPTSLTPREMMMAATVGAFLRTRGVFLAGIDLIDERLTEINITSPGLLWEWNEADEASHDLEIIEAIERRLGL